MICVVRVDLAVGCGGINLHAGFAQLPPEFVDFRVARKGKVEAIQ